MDDRLGITRKVVDGQVRSFYKDGRPVIWAPNPGSQQKFLECPAFEVLIEGNRGGGKTIALLVDFVQHVGLGFGSDWTGIIFRHTYLELRDLVKKTKEVFPRAFPTATFNESKNFWAWPSGEILYLSNMERPEDYTKYHGHEYPFIGWEELTTWPNDKCYKAMMSCSRSARSGSYDPAGRWWKMPRKYRATTNPSGVGHNWVKDRFKLPLAGGRLFKVVDVGEDRCVVHSSLLENQALMIADPDYKKKIAASAQSPAQLRAWLEGDWDVTSGGMLDDLWRPEVHLLPDIPFDRIPLEWRINRAYDHGQSKPFSVGWYAESNGEPIKIAGRKIGAVAGDIIRFAEYYGWNGTPNEGMNLSAKEIAVRILDMETEMGLKGRVRQGPADSSIFDDFQPGNSIAGEMKSKGLIWSPANKGPGSRKQGWQLLRSMLKAASATHREDPGFFVCERCDQFLRTVPCLPRSEKDPDDVDTNCEDHAGDEVRYRLREKIMRAHSKSF